LFAPRSPVVSGIDRDCVGDVFLKIDRTRWE